MVCLTKFLVNYHLFHARGVLIIYFIIRKRSFARIKFSLDANDLAQFVSLTNLISFVILQGPDHFSASYAFLHIDQLLVARTLTNFPFLFFFFSLMSRKVVTFLVTNVFIPRLLTTLYGSCLIAYCFSRYSRIGYRNDSQYWFTLIRGFIFLGRCTFTITLLTLCTDVASCTSLRMLLWAMLISVRPLSLLCNAALSIIPRSVSRLSQAAWRSWCLTYSPSTCCCPIRMCIMDYDSRSLYSSRCTWIDSIID